MQTDAYFIYINGQKVSCQKGQTILEVACQAGIEIPHFCYHPGVPTGGSCHICFVSRRGETELLNSCTVEVQENMDIVTTTDEIIEARQDTLKLLAETHPAECPVCVRAGECDLQDLTFLYGGPVTAASVPLAVKRKVKPLSPFIQGHMNRCIGCQRCISFLENVTGTAELGLFQGEEGFRIDTVSEEGIMSELSGNIIDLCPSGALVETPSGFMGKPWDTQKIDSIDVMDAMGSAIQLECREGKILRILPGVNLGVNQYWSTDKIRFSYDGLQHQRLEQPYIRKKGVLEPASWIDVFKTLVRQMSILQPSEMAFLVGDLVEVESVYLLRQLLDELKVEHRDCRVDGAFLPTEAREDYLFNTPFHKIRESDACLIIGADIRYDAPLLNVRLRDRYQHEKEKVAVIGSPQDLTFGYTYLGDSISVINEIAEGDHAFCGVLEKAQNPMVIVGMDALTGGEGEKVYAAARFIAEKYNMRRESWDGFNILHRAAGRVGALEVGFTPRGEGQDTPGILKMARAGKLKFLYLLGVDELPLNGLGETFIVYQGHHGDKGAEVADIILPGLAFPEKNGFYVNMEGRVQFASRAILPPGQAKEDWKIIRGLSEVLGHKLPYETHEDICKSLKKNYPAFAHAGGLLSHSASFTSYDYHPVKHEAGKKEKQNYYFTNPICRASPSLVKRVKHLSLNRKTGGIK